jgi:NTE family protein
MTARGDVAFVLGGGGVLGAHEVGMLQALLEAGIQPDLVIGTSVGAINGAVVAAEPTKDAIAQLTDLWSGIGDEDVFGGSVFSRVGTLVRSRTHLYSNEPLRQLLKTYLPAVRFADTQVPFQCVAASIEKAGAHWFTEGPIIEAVLASTAVPGLFPPVEIRGEHFFDGGLVHSIPVGRAVSLGARTVYVLQVGRVEEPLSVPTNTVETARVAFEIARRHRFARDLATLPEDVRLHVLPSGGSLEGDESPLAFRRLDTVHRRIERAYDASRNYLAGVDA